MRRSTNGTSEEKTIRPSDVRKLIANALRAVAETLEGPTIWPDSTDADRVTADAANTALDQIKQALIKEADNLMTSKRKSL